MSKAMQADIALLLVSASEDKDEIKNEEKVKQSHECFSLISILAIRKVLVVVSKMDARTWKRKSYEEIESNTTKFIDKYLGFKAHVDFKFLPLSVRNGWNLQTKMGKGVCDWFQGPCLFEALDAFEVPSRIKNSPEHKWEWDIDNLVVLVRLDLCIDKNPSASASWNPRSQALEALGYYAASFETAETAAQHGFCPVDEKTCPVDEKTCVASLMTRGLFSKNKSAISGTNIIANVELFGALFSAVWC